jgi:hypothetical protein
MKLLKYFLLVGVFAFATSCDDDLELVPEQSVNIADAFRNQVSAQASLMGVYSLAQDLDVLGGLTTVISEYQSDNVRFVGSFPTLQEINNYVTIASNTSIRSIWQDHYRAILAANAVINYVPTVEDPTFAQATRDQFVAEAKFMRALLNFNLVTMFGQPINVQNGNTPGIPLVFTTELLEAKDPILPARSSVAEVYAQIERDLTEALPALRPSHGSADQTRGRATQGAANALLSRVALYKGDWATTAQYADAVLANTALYAPASDYTFYDGNTSEDVFSLQMTATDNSRTGSGGWAGYFLPAARGGRGDCTFSADLLAAFDQANDKRFTTLTFAGRDAAGINGSIFTNKYKDGATNTDNSPLIRVTEVLLNKAEALARSTNSVDQTALGIVNQLRARAGLSAFTAADFATPDDFINAILTERRKELCFEGHRRMDLLRTGQSLRRTAPTADISKPGDPKIVLPIPQREIDLGAALPQNAGY